MEFLRGRVSNVLIERKRDARESATDGSNRGSNSSSDDDNGNTPLSRFIGFVCRRKWMWRDLKSHKSAPEKESWNTKLADRRDARAFYASVQALSVLEHVPFGSIRLSGLPRSR